MPDNICSHTTEVVGAFVRDSHIHLMPWDLNTNTCNNADYADSQLTIIQCMLALIITFRTIVFKF